MEYKILLTLILVAGASLGFLLLPDSNSGKYTDEEQAKYKSQCAGMLSFSIIAIFFNVLYIIWSF